MKSGRERVEEGEREERKGRERGEEGEREERKEKGRERRGRRERGEEGDEEEREERKERGIRTCTEQAHPLEQQGAQLPQMHGPQTCLIYTLNIYIYTYIYGDRGNEERKGKEVERD